MTAYTPLLALIAFIAGCGLSVQTAVNLELARIVGSPLIALTVSFLVGTIVLAVATVLTRQPWPTAGAAQAVPTYAWVAGGMLGAFFLFSVLLLAPRLGIAVVFSIAIAGQLIGALVLDHFGLLGTVVREATAGRIAGIVVMLTGVLMIRFL